MKMETKNKSFIREIKFGGPEKNDPTKEDDDNDSTGPKPGVTDPGKTDPTRKEDPQKIDPTRPDQNPKIDPTKNIIK